MARRRLLALLGLVGLTLAGLVLPAAAQTTGSPSIAINDMTPRCINQGGEGYVSGPTNQPAVRLEVFAPSGKLVDGSLTTGNQGSYRNTFGFAPAESGEHEARVTAGTTDRFGNFFATTAPEFVFIQVPCRAPTLEFSPSCSTPSTTQVRVTGRLFHPFSNAYVDMNNDGSEELFRLPVDNRGTFSGVVDVPPSSAARQVRGRDLHQNSALASWPACPPGVAPTTTTSTTSTTAPRVIQPDPDPAPEPTTTTARRNDPTPETPPVTLPPTLPPAVELPPATPGATVTLSPRIGPAGFVTGVTGTGFPPGPVALVWLPGIGTTTTVAGLDGTISARVLILPGDRLGPRALVATGSGGVTALDAFLVVPSTVQPSGQEVSQINRTRRFNNR